MDRINRSFLLFLLNILLHSSTCNSWGWLSSSSAKNTDSSFSRSIKSNPEFSIEVFSERKAVQVLENAQNKLVGPSSCWQNAYGYLMAGCKDMVATEEHRKRFAWHLSDCFQKESGRPDFPTESQLALREGQEKMGEAMKVGEKMTNKMTALENQTSVIGTMTNSTLDRQQKLLEGQSVAIESIQSLNQFQSEALQESRSTLQRFVEFSQEQQDDLAKRQEQLQQVHDHLFENSKSMLAAQEAFEAKQASMFVALDKLFALHNAMLLESRVIKAFFIYFLSIFVILALEVASLRFVNDAEHRAWIINLVRSLFAVLASAQLLHAAFTYRDYEVLNHSILLRLVDKVNNMQSKREISWDEDTDSEVDWNSWIDTDITDDGDSLGDPDYKIPEQMKDNLGFTSSMTNRLYNLRPR